MAITVLQSPSDGCSILRPNYFYLNSNLVNSYSDFKYIISLEWFDYDNNPTTPITIGKFRIAPNPTTGKAYFDISKIAQIYFNHIFKASYEIIAYQTDRVNVKLGYSFGEYYNGSEHFPISAANYLKCYYYYDDILANALNPSYPSTYRWLTDRDITNMQVPKNRNFYLPFNNIYYGSSVVQELGYNNYSNGSLYDTGTNTYPLAKQCVELNLNYLTLNQEVYGGSPPVDINAYDINFNYAFGETLDYATINYVCVKNNDLQIHFLNRFGAFETMSFQLANRENSNIERKTFKSNGLTALTSAVVDYNGYVAPSLGFTTYVKNFKEQVFYENKTTEYTLVSPYMNEQDFKWLQQLINSPKVYVEKYNPDITIVYPCTIVTSEWNQKLQGADKIFNLELKIKVGEQIL